jgi:hypothetical protein
LEAAFFAFFFFVVIGVLLGWLRVVTRGCS